MSLATIQKNFKQALVENKLEALLEQVRPVEMRSQEQSIAVYQNNMRGGLVNVLEQVYPATRHYLSERYFLPVARGFVQMHPSQNQDLNGYGKDFPQFIKQLQGDYPELAQHAFLPDLALAEQYCHQSYYAKDTPTFDFPLFQKAVDKHAPGTIYFSLAPSLFLLKSVHPLKQLAEKASQIRPPSVQTQAYCINRKQWHAVIEEIDEAMAGILQGLVEKKSLATLSEQIPSLHEHLPALIEKSWVCGFLTRK